MKHNSISSSIFHASAYILKKGLASDPPSSRSRVRHQLSGIVSIRQSLCYPHSTPRPALFKVYFVHGPEIDIFIVSQEAEFFYALPASAGRIVRLPGEACGSEIPTHAVDVDIVADQAALGAYFLGKPASSFHPTDFQTIPLRWACPEVPFADLQALLLPPWVRQISSPASSIGTPRLTIRIAMKFFA
jgi:hypothetical protein